MLNRSIGILILWGVASFIGCGSLFSEETDMSIERIGILSVSEDRPATVVMGVLGSHSDTCTDGSAQVSADRDGETIQFTATMQVSTGLGLCGDAVSDVYGEVTIRDLDVGEYKVMSGSRELLKFRITANAGYVKSGPIIEFVYFTIKTADGVEVSDPRPDIETAEPVQVTMGVVGYFDSKCIPYLNTHIERKNRWSEWGDTGDYTIDVDILGEVPIVNTECAHMIFPNRENPNLSYTAEIELGMLSVGNYDIRVNDYSKAYFYQSSVSRHRNFSSVM